MIRTIVQDTSGGKTVGPAIPIEIMPSALGQPVDGRILRVVQVTNADIAAGRAKAVGGRPMPVVMGVAGNDMVDGPIQQVYVVSGVLT